MFYIVEHDHAVHQIIDRNGKANKYRKALLFNNYDAAMHWIYRHKSGLVYGSSIIGNVSYEIKEATPEQIKDWGR